MDIEFAIPSNYQRLWYLWCPLTLKFLQYKLVMTAVPKPVPHYSIVHLVHLWDCLIFLALTLVLWTPLSSLTTR